MDTNTLLIAGTFLALTFALPGAVLSFLLLKDRWNHFPQRKKAR